MGGSELWVDTTAGDNSSLCFCHDEAGPSFCACSGCGLDDLVVQEIGLTLGKALHIHNNDEFVGSDPSSDLDEICDGNDILLGSDPSSDLDEICDGNDILSLPLNSILTNGLAVAEDEVVESYPVSPDGSEVKSPSTALVSNGGSSDNATRKLVSAMKGSRAQQGIILESNLSVKWAPDVYDPPVTSGSHTVKGHQRRPKAVRKDYYKQKYSKCRSSRHSSSKKEKKHSHRSSSSSKMIDPWMLRLQAAHEKVVRSNFALQGMEDVMTLHRPLAEAS